MLKKVLLADDHIVLRDALAALINGFPGFLVTDVASDGVQLVEIIKNGKLPDIVILDLNMPNMDGYDTARWLHSNYPDVIVLILTMYDSEIAMIRLLHEGVKGFLKKDISPGELQNAVEIVARGGFYYSHQTTGKLGALFQKSNDNQTSIEKAILTESEINFLKLASTEMTYKEIAGTMKLTPRVIDSYRDALFDKLNVKSRVGLAIYAVKNGVVTF